MLLAALFVRGFMGAEASSGTWMPRAPMPVALVDPAVGVILDTIYVAGGRDPYGRPTAGSILEAYDPGTDTWTRKADIPEPTYFASGCTLNGIFYIINGQGNEHVLAYDPSSNKWSRKADLPPQESYPQAHNRRCVGSFGGLLYAVGPDGVFAYSPVRDYWQQLPSPALPANPSDFSFTMTADRIVAVGPETRSLQVGGGDWETLTPMSDPVNSPALASDGSHIFTVGGLDGFQKLREVMDLDAQQNVWKRLEPFPYAVEGTGLAVVGGTLYALGGFTNRGSTTSIEAYTPQPERQPKPTSAADRGTSYFDGTKVLVQGSHSKDFAIVVGVDNYRSLPASHGAANDAASIAGMLERGVGVPAENVILLTGSHASRADLESYIDEWLPKNINQDSRLYFYFAGSGSIDPVSGARFILPWDADLAFLSTTAYPLDALFRRFRALKAREVVIIFDSCFDRESDRCRVAKGIRPLGTVSRTIPLPDSKLTVLFATSSGQEAALSPQGDRGAFTAGLISGFEDAVARRAGLTVEQLFQYASGKVRRVARASGHMQTPRLYTSERGLKIN